MSTDEVGVESTELVVGVVDTVWVVDAVSVDVGVGSGVGVGLTVAETVSVEAGAVEVSAVGVVGSVLVGAEVSVAAGAVEVSATGAGGSVVVAVVSVAVSRRSVILPPLESIVMSFAILVTHSPTTEEQ